MALLSTAFHYIGEAKKALSMVNASGVSLPVVASVPGDDALGALVYAAGTGGATVTVPANALCMEVSGYAEATDGTITIDGGAVITVRAGGLFVTKPLTEGSFDVVFSASMDYYVAWRV